MIEIIERIALSHLCDDLELLCDTRFKPYKTSDFISTIDPKTTELIDSCIETIDNLITHIDQLINDNDNYLKTAVPLPSVKYKIKHIPAAFTSLFDPAYQAYRDEFSQEYEFCLRKGLDNMAFQEWVDMEIHFGKRLLRDDYEDLRDFYMEHNEFLFILDPEKTLRAGDTAIIDGNKVTIKGLVTPIDSCNDGPQIEIDNGVLISLEKFI